MDDRRHPGRATPGGMLLGGAALAAVTMMGVVGGAGPVGAQQAPSPYTCPVDSLFFPPGTVFTAQVSAGATAPATADVGTSVDVTGIAVDVQFDPAELAFVLEIVGDADLGPAGSADLGSTGIGEDGLAAFAGGTGSVTATGTPGNVMDVTLDAVTLVIPSDEGSTPLLTATCTPTGDAAVLASIELTGELQPTTTTTTSPTSPTTTQPPVSTPPPARPITAPPTQSG